MESVRGPRWKPWLAWMLDCRAPKELQGCGSITARTVQRSEGEELPWVETIDEEGNHSYTKLYMYKLEISP